MPLPRTESPMVFLEVDPEDTAVILAKYPSARVVDHPCRGQELVDACKDAAVISLFIHSAVDREALKQLPSLQLLCTRSVGCDHIDVEACREKNIAVCNVPDYGSHVIAEHVFALLLSTMRHITEAHERMEEGRFDYHGLRGMSLRGKTIGIAGTGRIGRKVAQIAHGFGMKILASDRCRTIELVDLLGVEYVTIDELFERSDILTLHVPADPSLNHMLNAAAFARMKDGVILVNTARGSLIDTPALFSALNSGKVGNALLDVLEHESNFEESKELVHHPRVVTTPHIAFYADDSMSNMYRDCFLSIDQWMREEVPEHVVKPLRIVCDLPPFHPLS